MARFNMGKALHRKPTSSAKTVSKKTKDNASKISLLALVIGYNELAKQADVLGDKVWYRLAREDALKRLREAGGDLEVTPGDKVILTLQEYPVRVAFTTADIELMRKAVADYDEEHLNWREFEPLFKWRSQSTDRYGDDLVSLLVGELGSRPPHPNLPNNLIHVWQKFGKLDEEKRFKYAEAYEKSTNPGYHGFSCSCKECEQ
jgi:hypothetical protein